MGSLDLEGGKRKSLFTNSLILRWVVLASFIKKEILTYRMGDYLFLFLFLAFAPRGGVTGRLEFKLPYGNFFLSAG